MKYIIRLMFAFVMFFSGAALVPFVGLPAEGYRWQPYADAYTPMMLEINHTSGMPGSFFTITGLNFPPDTSITILVNGTVLGPVQSDSAGSFTFQIDTTGADPGYYIVSTDQPNSPITRFHLSVDEPLYPQEGGGTIFNLPAGIAQVLLNLPIILH